jgi:diaminopimelate epimerase
MTGPAEAVFHGQLAHGQLAHESEPAGSEPAGAEPAEAESAGPSDAELPKAAAIDCAVACVQGCVRPEACPNAEARARVQQLLEGRSLDELVAIATNSLEDRLMGRLPRDGGRAG